MGPESCLEMPIKRSCFDLTAYIFHMLHSLFFLWLSVWHNPTVVSTMLIFFIHLDSLAQCAWVENIMPWQGTSLRDSRRSPEPFSIPMMMSSWHISRSMDYPSIPKYYMPQFWLCSLTKVFIRMDWSSKIKVCNRSWDKKLHTSSVYAQLTTFLLSLTPIQSHNPREIIKSQRRYTLTLKIGLERRDYL